MPESTSPPVTAGKYVVDHEDHRRQAARRPNDLPAISATVGSWEVLLVDYSGELGEPAIQMEIFDDAFAAFTEIPWFFTTLATERPNTLHQVRTVLDRLGFVDATERVQPAGVVPAAPAAWRFNPAPGWPPCPPDWIPPQGWRPDPLWPPAPEGWQFWVRG